MSRRKYFCQAPGGDKGFCPLHALHFGEVIARSWPAGTPKVEEVELRKSFKVRTGDCGQMRFQKENKPGSAAQGLAGSQSRKVPRPRWRPFGPAYPQDEPAEVPVTGGFCLSRFSRLYKLRFWLEFQPKRSRRNEGQILGGRAGDRLTRRIDRTRDLAGEQFLSCC